MIEPLEGRRLLSAATIAVPAMAALSISDVGTILANAASQARAGQVAAVVDREGTVLGIFSRTGGNSSETDTLIGLAIQRARTAAAFESSQNAFTTRTARFIIQNHFPYPVRRTAGGPLYGVEFSAFPGGDILASAYQSGISGDPGGVPLYLNGVPVGGIGVSGDGRDKSPTAELKPVLASLRGSFADRSLTKTFNGTEERDFDESVAIAGTRGYAAPKKIRATNILLDGLRLPFTSSPRAKGQPDESLDQLVTNGLGSLVASPSAGKADATIVAGMPRLTNGEVAGVPGLFRNRQAAGASGPQEATRTAINDTIASDDTAAVTLSKDDVDTIIRQAVEQAVITRAGIRKPNGVPAQVHVVVVDRDGTVLGVFRMADGTNFSYDVAVQKARTAAFFSDDSHAISTRAVGFMSQKYFPPGIEHGLTGPLFQLQDRINVVRNTDGTVALHLPDLQDAGDVVHNGITVFPGGVPLYKDGTLVGAVGVSGDGVDQDDLISFAGESGFRPADSIRSDHLGAGDLTNYILGKATLLATDAAVPLGTGPTEFDAEGARSRLTAGLKDVRLPYVKFPRNPTHK